MKRKAKSRTNTTSKSKQKKSPLKKILITIVISLAVLVVGLHFISVFFLGVPITALTKDALMITGVTGPTVEEITELPIEEVNENVNEFIEAFNEASDDPEPIGLEEGVQGLRVLDGDDIILEATFEVRKGEIISIDYTGIQPDIAEEDVVEMPEEIFRVVFSGEIPESLPGAIEAYSESR